MSNSIEPGNTIDSTIPLPTENFLADFLRSRSTLSRSDLETQVQSLRDARVSDTHSQGSTVQQEFIIPIRLTAIQRKVYKSLILKHARSIEAFCLDPADQEASSSIRSLINLLQLCSIHPMLLADTAQSSESSGAEDAWYIVQASSKFEMLIDLIEALKQHPLRIAVVCNDNRIRTLLVRVLKGLQVRYSRADVGAADESTQDNSLGELEVLLMSNDSEELETGSTPDVCIALDNDSSSPYFPLLRFIATNTVEHVLRQVSDLPTVISITTSISDVVGICSYDSGEIIKKVVQYFSSGSLRLEELKELKFSSSQFDVISYVASNGDRKTDSNGSLISHTHIFEPEPPSRIIISEINGLEVHTEEPAASLLEKHASQGMSSALIDRQIPEPTDFPEILSLPDPDQTQFISPIHLEKKPSQAYNEVRNEIWSKNTPDQERIISLEAEIDRILSRFDDLREQCRSLAELKDEAQSVATSYQRRFEKLLEENKMNRMEKNDIKMELDRLKMPALPDETSPDYMNVENQRLKSELEKVKKSSLSKAQDFEFVRQQYQEASSAAVELASENKMIKEDLQKAIAQLDGGLGYKMAVARTSAANEALLAEVENLSLRNNVLIEQLRRMRDDRLGTRGRGDGRRENIQERKRATSANDVGQRKKLDKLGASRLSVASLIHGGKDPKQSQAMVRGRSHDPSSFTKERDRQAPAARSRAPL